MTEHHAHHNADGHGQPESKANGFNQITGSILLGSVILAASMFYNAKLIMKKLDEGGAVKSTQNTVQQAAPAPSPAQAPGQPAAPVSVPDREGQPVTGNKNAKVTVVEFAEFQCPFCKRYFDDAYKQVKAKYIDTGKIKYVYRHFPLAFHQNAEIAGVAAECANRQGKFWEYHDILFAKGAGDGTGLSLEDLKKYGDELGLNRGTLGFKRNQFSQCLDNKETLQAVKDDNNAGLAAGVSGTPTFVINGKLLVGAQPFTAFEQAIEAALNE